MIPPTGWRTSPPPASTSPFGAPVASASWCPRPSQPRAWRPLTHHCRTTQPPLPPQQHPRCPSLPLRAPTCPASPSGCQPCRWPSPTTPHPCSRRGSFLCRRRQGDWCRQPGHQRARLLVPRPVLASTCAAGRVVAGGRTGVHMRQRGRVGDVTARRTVSISLRCPRSPKLSPGGSGRALGR